MTGTRELRAQDLLRAPAGAALFALAHRSGYGHDALADPPLVSALAAACVGRLSPWLADEPPADRRARLIAQAAPAEGLAVAAVADPRNRWWTAPVDRSSQLHLTDEDRVDPGEPQGPNDGWETYAQRSLAATWTSTELSVPPTGRIRSGAHAELVCGGSDWAPSFPLRQTRLQVFPAARVYEVTSPQDWHELALRYGDRAAYSGPDRQLLSDGGIDHGLAPTWSAVAADWDGVHLSFAGLLTSLFVPVTTGTVTTTLWSWSWESTHWLRPVFTAVEPLPDLAAPPPEPWPDPWPEPSLEPC